MSKEKPKLTRQQQKALHLFFELKAKQCEEAGVTMQKALQETIEIEMTPQMMKEIYREVMKSLYNKSSTTELNKTGEIEEVAEHLNRFFAEKFNLEGIEFPSEEHRSELFEAMREQENVEYPEEDYNPTF